MASDMGASLRLALPYAVETETKAYEQLRRICDGLDESKATGDLDGILGQVIASRALFWTRELKTWLKLKWPVPLKERRWLTKWFWNATLDATEVAVAERFASAASMLWKPRRGADICYALERQENLVDWPRLVTAVTKLISQDPSAFYTMDHPVIRLGLSLGTAQYTAEDLNIACESILSFTGSDTDSAVMWRALIVAIPASRRPARPEICASFCNLWKQMPQLVDAQEFMVLFGRIGRTPHSITESQIDAMFSLIVRVLDLPIATRGRRQNRPPRPHRRIFRAFAKLILAHWSSSMAERLRTLMRLVETFVHPTNADECTPSILEMIHEIATAWSLRVYYPPPEYFGEDDNDNDDEVEGTVDAARECGLDSNEIVSILLPNVLSGIRTGRSTRSTTAASSAISTLQILATLAPDVVMPRVLRDAYTTLQNLNCESQRKLEALAMLSHVVRPLTNEPKWRVHLSTLVELTLPNIDVSDGPCTLFALQFIHAAAHGTPFSGSDDPSLAAEWLPVLVDRITDGLNSDELPTLYETDIPYEDIARSSMTAFVEVAPAILSRVLDLLDSLPETDVATGMSCGNNEALLLHTAPVCMNAVCAAVSEDVLTGMLSRVVSAISDRVGSPDSFAQLVGSVVRANPSRGWPAVWHVLNSAIRHEVLENGAGRSRSRLSRDKTLVRLLGVLNMALISSFDSILPDAEDIIDLIRFLRTHTRQAVMYSVANVVHHAISTVTGTWHQPSSSTHSEQNSASKDEESTDAPFPAGHWTVPSPEGLVFAARLYLEHSVVPSPDLDPDATVLSLVYVRVTTAAAAPLFRRKDDEAGLVQVNFPWPPGSELGRQVAEARDKCGRDLAELLKSVGRDNAQVLKELLFAIKVWFSDIGIELTGRIENVSSSLYQYEMRLYCIPGMTTQSLPADVQARRESLYHWQRLAYNTAVGGGRSCDYTDIKLLKSVVDACFSAYPAVRRNSYAALYSALRSLKSDIQQSLVYPELLSKIRELISSKEPDYERALGGLEALAYRSLHGLVRKGIDFVEEWFSTILEAVSIDYNRLNIVAFQNFNSNVSIVFHLPACVHRDSEARQRAEASIGQVVTQLAHSLTAGSQQWRVEILNAAALVAAMRSPQLHPTSLLLEALTKGLSSVHPETRRTALHGLLLGYETLIRIRLAGSDVSFLCLGNAPLTFGNAEFTSDTLASMSQRSYFRKTQVAAVEDGYTWPYEFNGPKIPRLFNGRVLPRWLELRLIEPEQSGKDRVDTRAAHLVRTYAVLLSHKMADGAIEDILDNAIFVNPLLDDRHWHRVAAELLEGLVEALPLVYPHDRAWMEPRIASIFRVAVFGMAPESLAYWVSFVRILANIDHPLIPNVIKVLRDAIDPSCENETRSRVTARINLVGSWLLLRPPISPFWIDVHMYFKEAGHDYQSVRLAVGSLIAQYLITRLKSVHRSSFQQSLNADEKILKISDLEKNVVAFMVTAISEATIPEAKTLVHIILCLLNSGSWVVQRFLIKGGMAPLLKLSTVRDDPELMVDLTNVFTELSSVSFKVPGLEDTVAMIEEAMRDRNSWHEKIRILLFIQGFYFGHLYLLSKAQRMSIVTLVEGALEHPQTEVRSVAAETLSGIVRCSPDQDDLVKDIKARLLKSLGATRHPTSPAMKVVRHGAILGLGALISAFPYTSPPPRWLAECLATLAMSSGSEPGFLGASVKQALGDFKRTRQDTWVIDKTVFEPEWLDALDGVLWKNYFA